MKSKTEPMNLKHGPPSDSILDNLAIYITKCEGNPNGYESVFQNAVNSYTESVTQPKFMYVKTKGGLDIFKLNGRLEIMGEPVATLSKSDVKQIGKMLPNTYYPKIKQKAPPEVKAVYKTLKDGYGNFIPEGKCFVEIYKKKKFPFSKTQKRFVGSLELLSGR